MERAIKFNIMSTPTQCTASSWRCDAISKSGEFHTIKIWDETKLKNVKKDAFITLINYSVIKKYITITRDTKLFTSTQFDIDEQTFATYNDPVCVEIKNAEKSPVKSRWKLKGVIEEVKPYTPSKWWTKQIMVFRDKSGLGEVKLWNQPELQPSAQGEEVEILNVEVTEWTNSNTKQTYKNLETLPHSKVKIIKEEMITHEIVVFGINSEGPMDKQHQTILDQDLNEYQLEDTITMDDTFLDKKLKISVTNSTIPIVKSYEIVETKQNDDLNAPIPKTKQKDDLNAAKTKQKDEMKAAKTKQKKDLKAP